MKKQFKINKKKVKVRKTWTRSPSEQIIPNKKKEDKPFNDSLYRGQKITEEDLENYNDDFERGIK
jgi:hypothetical protein